MNSNILIPLAQFRDAFDKVGWVHETSRSGRYELWTSPFDADIWTRLPSGENDPDYLMYQEKNILMLLYALGLPEEAATISEIISQLHGYNYKLINRIVSTDDARADVVPFELAHMVPQRNIDAFKFFYSSKSKKRKTIPIEKFELNHTQKGSFVIPISIMAEEQAPTLMPSANDTNIILHQYLGTIDRLMSIPRKEEAKFADRVISESIDSRIVKIFFGRTESIAKYKEKYSDRVKDISISSKGSLLLDYRLPEQDKYFQEVDLGSIEPLEEGYLDVLEKREILADDSTLSGNNVEIDVVVDAIDRKGSAKFTVVGVDGQKLLKPFKGRTTQLPKAKLDRCAEFFKNNEVLTVLGDIEKSKGKQATIVVDLLDTKETPPSLFDDKTVG